MLPYFILVIIPLLLYFYLISKKNREITNKYTLTMFFVIFFLVLSLRNIEIGTDISGYKNFFYRMSQTPWDKLLNSTDVEIGYVILNKIVSIITNDFQWFLIICATITLIPVYIIYKNESTYANISIVLFINMSTFVMMFSGLRQAIAISLGMVAYFFTKQKKFIPFILIVILSIAFHSSAFMLFIMYPLYHIKITKKWLYFVIPLFTLIMIFNKSIFTSLIKFLPDKYNEYNVKSTSAYTMIILLVLFALYCFIIPRKDVDENTRGLRNFLLLSVILQMFAPLHTIAMRMNYYYLIFIPLLIPKVISQYDLQWKQVTRVSYYIIIIFFGLYFFITAYTGADILNVFPYKAFWEV